MPLFKYKSIAQDGKVRLGSLEAANEVDLEKRLSRMKLELIHAKESREKSLGFGKPRIEKADLIVFSMHLGQLIRAGAPLIPSLIDLRDSMDQPHFKEVIANLIDLIEGGKKLSQALAEYPDIFDTLYINLVAAGEASGKLAESFESLATMLKWQDELSTSTRKLLTTPLFVGSVVLGVTFFLMVYLVPQLVEFLENTGEELPMHTRALIAVSGFMTNYWYLLLIIPVVVFITCNILVKTNVQARYIWDDIKLRIWKVGPVYKKILISRFANFFSMLYSSGIPILTSLEISEGVVSNQVIRQALEDARHEIEQGESISQGFSNTRIFPPLIIRMLKIGEARGELDKALLDVGYFYERDINDAISSLQAMIQPAMTMVLGLLLGWVMLSVLGPVYSSLSSIS